MPRPPPRARYNAKARGSVAGGTIKRGKPTKQLASAETVGNSLDTNAEIIAIPSLDLQAERKAAMRAELIATSESKISSKKKKKLDSYIDKKLKKEERVLLFEKLALVKLNSLQRVGGLTNVHRDLRSRRSQKEVSSVALQSSSTLGTGHIQTNAQRLAHDEDNRVRRQMDGILTAGSSRKKRRRISHAIAIDAGVSDDEDEDGSNDEDADDGPSTLNDRDTTISEKHTCLIHRSPVLPLSPDQFRMDVTIPKTLGRGDLLSAPVAVGAGLKRAADGSVVAPRVVPKRQKPSRTMLRRGVNSLQQRAYPANESSHLEQNESGPDSEPSNGEDSNISDNNDEHPVSGSPSADEENEADDDSSGVGNSSEEDVPAAPSRKNFKEWAQQQINLSKGPDQADAEHNTENLLARQVAPRASHVYNGVMRGPLGEDLAVPKTSFATAALQSLKAITAPSEPSDEIGIAPSRYVKRHVTVNRSEAIREARLSLPVVAEEQTIVEAIRLNPVVVICGETGSGKTTQVPQFLYEAGFGTPGSDNPGMIGITQPRRVAAMAMASRVATELSLPSSKVSYQIRYDATVSPATTIKFMTDGVLLRELATDFMLRKYSAIIVDEAHERSMNTDILVGVLSRVMRLRAEMWESGTGDIKPLRLIIMSATLRVGDFTENKTLFLTTPPLITISARQHSVTSHFSRRTPGDYVTAAVRKATRIHARLPPGGILIFLTGQDEINTVCRKLGAKFGQKALENKGRKHVEQAQPRQGVEFDETDVLVQGIDSDADDLNAQMDGDNNDNDSDALNTDDEEDPALDVDVSEVPMHIVPLYSMLSSENQMKAFQPPPDGTRLVVVATNVAETSLTIPGVRYVVDCGRAKQREYDNETGIQTFKVTWISKASASQRAGRAGRTGPGHVYRLYSSAVFEHQFDAFAAPEILRVPIEGVVLQMKSMHIDAVANFPFPTPPDRVALKRAETLLTHLGALDFDKSKKAALAVASTPRMTVGGHITELGKAMSLFPVSPRFSKMLVSSRQHGIMPYVIAIVAALSAGNPFIHEKFLRDADELRSEDNHDEVEHNDAPAELRFIKNPELYAKELRRNERRRFYQSQQLHSRLGNGTSDVFRTLSVVGAYEFSGGGAGFCADHFVRPKAMEEIHKLRSQISTIVHSNFPADASAVFEPRLPPPTPKQLKILRQLLTAGFIDHLAVRKDLTLKTPEGTQFASARGVPYVALDVDEDVYIHPTSVLFHGSPPNYVVFQEVVRSSKVYIKCLTVINQAWLPSLAPSMCTFSKPKDVPSSMKNSSGVIVTPRFGDKFVLPPIKI